MNIINTFEYRGRYSRNDVISKPDAVQTIISCVKYDTSDKNNGLNIRYGVVEEAIGIVSSHVMLMLVTPTSRKHDSVKDTIVLKRTHLRNVIGLNIVNPNKLMWSVNVCDKRLDDMLHNDWSTRVAKMNTMDSNYVLVSCNNNANWLKLADVKNNLMIVPKVDDLKLYDSSRVGLIDTLYQERSRLLDFRHMTSSDDKRNHVYNSK